MAGYKKIPDRYTPFYDSLSDKESREAHRRDEAEYSKPINNTFAGKTEFRGTVMSPVKVTSQGTVDQNANIKKTETYIRLEGLTDGGLCEPTAIEAAGNTPDQKVQLYNYVLTCHPKAQSRGGETDDSTTHLRPSDVVSCGIQDGPAYMGRVRGISFDGTRVDRSPGFNKPGSFGQASIQNLIAEAGTTSGGGAGGQLGNYLAGAGTPAETGVANEPMTSTDSQFAKPSLHAASFSKSSKRPGSIKYIMLHSTDGRRGPANKTLERFARGPTIGFSWKHPTTGKIIKNPLLSEYQKFNPGKLPEKGVVRERKYTGTAQKHIEIKVSTSIHYAVDGLEEDNIWQGLAEKDVGHHAPGFNTTSVGIEMCGKPNKNPGKGAKPSYSEMYNEIMLNNCAKLCADICKRNNLQPTREVIRGHEDGQGSNRTDPGESKGNFDYTDFLARVANYFKQMGGVIA
jgi:hypothetical protein